MLRDMSFSVIIKIFYFSSTTYMILPLMLVSLMQSHTLVLVTDVSRGPLKVIFLQSDLWGRGFSKILPSKEGKQKAGETSLLPPLHVLGSLHIVRDFIFQRVLTILICR
jgi:hypothetical protein